MARLVRGGGLGGVLSLVQTPSERGDFASIRPTRRHEVAGVTAKIGDGVARIFLDDGKVNALSSELMGELGKALDEAEAAQAVTVLRGRAGHVLGRLRPRHVQARPRRDAGDAARRRGADRAAARVPLPRRHRVYRPRVPDGRVPDAGRRRALRRRGSVAHRHERGRDRAHRAELRARDRAPPPDPGGLRADHDRRRCSGRTRRCATATSTTSSTRRGSMPPSSPRSRGCAQLDRPAFVATKARINARALESIRAAIAAEL